MMQAPLARQTSSRQYIRDSRMPKLNDVAKWVLIALAILTIAYNTVVTHAVVRNDVKHLQQDVVRVEQGLAKLYDYLLSEK